jgi:hypothetical protein
MARANEQDPGRPRAGCSSVDMEAAERVEAHIDELVKKGAKVAVGGKRRSAFGGTSFEPTVSTDVTTDMAITKEETFNPVAPLYRFKTDDEAVKMANDTEFGLAAYFYSRDRNNAYLAAGNRMNSRTCPPIPLLRENKGIFEPEQRNLTADQGNCRGNRRQVWICVQIDRRCKLA